jgi:hypothetical protein
VELSSQWLDNSQYLLDWYLTQPVASIDVSTKIYLTGI